MPSKSGSTLGTHVTALRDTGLDNVVSNRETRIKNTCTSHHHAAPINHDKFHAIHRLPTETSATMACSTVDAIDATAISPVLRLE